MKKLIWNLVLPLAIISFAIVTKWWYALPEDAPDSFLAGFPFPFVCDGWHTSMSLQFFITELVVDFLVYFLFWFIIIFCINRFLVKINLHRLLAMALWIICVGIISFAGLIASSFENLFYVKRSFDMEVLETGYKFVWQHTERPDISKYITKEKLADTTPIDANNIKGNWYLNKWTMYHTLSFSDSTVFVDNNIDSVFTLNYSFLKDTLILKHAYLPASYKNKIITLTKDTLVIEGLGDVDSVLRYSRTKRAYQN